MTRGRPGAYARAVEDALARARGRPSLLSPRDWARVADWCARGVPLAVVLEAIEEAAARARRRGGELRGLALVAPAVEESWRAVEGGRSRAVPPGPAPDLAGAWRQAAAGRAGSDRLARWLETALDRLASGVPAVTLEDELDLHLTELAGEASLERVSGEVDRALEPFRKRMTESVFLATRARARLDGLRRLLGLPPRTA